VIRTDLEAITRVYLGQLGLTDAQNSGLLKIEGPPELAKGVDDWFPLSGFAPHGRAVRYDPHSRSFQRIDAYKSRTAAGIASN
jgi:hypothetical protein